MCVYVSSCVCVSLWLHIYVCRCICMRLRMSLRVRVYVCVCTCVYPCMCVCVWGGGGYVTSGGLCPLLLISILCAMVRPSCGWLCFFLTRALKSRTPNHQFLQQCTIQCTLFIYYILTTQVNVIILLPH